MWHDMNIVTFISSDNSCSFLHLSLLAILGPFLSTAGGHGHSRHIRCSKHLMQSQKEKLLVLMNYLIASFNQKKITSSP